MQGPVEVGLAYLPQLLRCHEPAAHPCQDLRWRPYAIVAFAVCPMRGGIERFHKRRVLLLQLVEVGGPCKGCVSDLELDRELRLDQVSPGFASLDVDRLDTQCFE